jgi:hypothetical protein
MARSRQLQKESTMRLLLATCSLLAFATAPALAADLPPLLKRAMDQHAQDIAGIVAFEARANSDFHAPIFNGVVKWRAWVIQREGKSVDTVLISLIKNGHAASVAEREKMETQMNHNHDTTLLPYDKRYAAAYTFAATRCAPCEAGEQAFSFRSTVRDKDHGDGQLVVGPDGHIKRMTYTPNEMQAHVSSASVALEVASVGPHWWGVTHYSAQFAGGVGPVKGGMILEQAQVGYRRFASVAAARQAAPK